MTDVATFGKPSLTAQLNELRRERGMRNRVYPHLIATGKMKARDALYQNLALDAAIETIDKLIDQEKNRET